MEIYTRSVALHKRICAHMCMYYYSIYAGKRACACAYQTHVLARTAIRFNYATIYVIYTVQAGCCCCCWSHSGSGFTIFARTSPSTSSSRRMLRAWQARQARLCAPAALMIIKPFLIEQFRYTSRSAPVLSLASIENQMPSVRTHIQFHPSLGPEDMPAWCRRYFLCMACLVRVVHGMVIRLTFPDVHCGMCAARTRGGNRFI